MNIQETAFCQNSDFEGWRLMSMPVSVLIPSLFSRPTLYSLTIMSLQRNRCVRCWREEFFLAFTVLLVIGMCLGVDGNQNTIRPQAAQFRAKVQIVWVVIIVVKTSVWPQSSSCEILQQAFRQMLLMQGLPLPAHLQAKGLGLLWMCSIAFTVIGRWYQKMATGGRRFVCRVPSLQNEAAPSLAGQISQSSEAQVRSKTVCPVKNIGQITFDTQIPVPLGWIKTWLFVEYVTYFYCVIKLCRILSIDQIHLCRHSLRIWMRMMRSLKKRAVLSATVVWIVAFGCIHSNFSRMPVQPKKVGNTTQMWSCIRSRRCIIYVHSSCHMYDYDFMYTVTYLSCVFCLLSSWITHHVCMIQQRSYLI